MSSQTPIYLLALAWGLAGGFSHCIGMCGVFVVSYAGMPDKGDRRRFLHPERHLLFHGGRLLALGALGLLGGALGGLSHRWAAAQGAVSVGVGVLMLGLALGMAGNPAVAAPSGTRRAGRGRRARTPPVPARAAIPLRPEALLDWPVRRLSALRPDLQRPQRHAGAAARRAARC